MAGFGSAEDGMGITSSASRSIKSPPDALVEEVSGMLYMALNGVKRLVHVLIKASDGLVSQESADSECQKLEVWVQKATSTMQKQCAAATQLRTMLDIYEKNVWDKTQAYAKLEMQQGQSATEKDELIASLQEKLGVLEEEVHVLRSKSVHILEDSSVQTEPVVIGGQQLDPSPGKRRTKACGAHPIFLKLTCLACKAPMTRRRWKELTRSSQKALSSVQRDVDRYVHEKQQQILSLLPAECGLCHEKKIIEDSMRPFEAVNLPSAEGRNGENSLMNILLNTTQDKVVVSPSTATAAPQLPITPESLPVKDDDVSSHSSRESQTPKNKGRRLLTGFGFRSTPSTSAQGTAETMATLVNKWRDRGEAFDVLLKRGDPKEKIGLRLKDSKGLQVVGFDEGTPSSALQDRIPIGGYLVAVDGRYVARMGQQFRLLVGGKAELVMTFLPRPPPQDPQAELAAIQEEENERQQQEQQQQQQRQQQQQQPPVQNTPPVSPVSPPAPLSPEAGQVSPPPDNDEESEGVDLSECPLAFATGSPRDKRPTKDKEEGEQEEAEEKDACAPPSVPAASPEAADPLAVLESLKQAAVVREDYSEAQRLNDEIRAKRSGHQGLQLAQLRARDLQEGFADPLSLLSLSCGSRHPAAVATESSRDDISMTSGWTATDDPKPAQRKNWLRRKFERKKQGPATSLHEDAFPVG